MAHNLFVSFAKFTTVHRILHNRLSVNYKSHRILHNLGVLKVMNCVGHLCVYFVCFVAIMVMFLNGDFAIFCMCSSLAK